MDTSKVSQGQLIAAAGGVLLIVSLFLDWISGVTVSIGSASVSAGGGNAFDVFSGMDIILLLVGIVAIGLAGAAAMEAGTDLPVNAAWILALLGVGAAGWALGWDLENPNAGIGAWIGLIAAIAIAFGGFDSAGQPRAVAAPSGASSASGPAAPAGSSAPPPA